MSVADVATNADLDAHASVNLPWRAPVEWVERVAGVGVALLLLVAPFEALRPLLHLPGQSVSTVETALLCLFATVAVTSLLARTWPPIPWADVLPLGALAAASVASALLAPAFRANAAHMAARVAVAVAVCGLTAVGTRRAVDRARLMAAATVVGTLVSVLVIADFAGLPAVTGWLGAFRHGVAVVGAQVRASGPFQYPTIASMFLEVTFALGLGVLVSRTEGSARVRLVLVAALALMAEAVVLTFTRAGLITLALSLVVVAWSYWHQHGRDRVLAMLALLTLVLLAELASSRSAEMLVLRMTSEGQGQWFSAEIQAPSSVQISTTQPVRVPLTITNSGRTTWDSRSATPILLSYHWVSAESDDVVAWEGERTPFDEPVRPGETVQVMAMVGGPGRPGHFRLMWDLEQVNRLWFSTEPGAVPVFTDGTVTGSVVSMQPYRGNQRIPRTEVRLGRVQLWRAAWRMWLTSPWTGVGADNFRLLYGPHAGVPVADARVHSNNMYVEVLAGTGVLGAAALIWLGVRIGRAVLAMLHGHVLGFGIAAAAIACAVHGLVDSFLSFTGTYVLLAVVLGLTASQAREWRHAHRI